MSCCTGSSQVRPACSLHHAYCTLAYLVEACTARVLCCLKHADTPITHVQEWRQLSWTTRRQPG